MNSTFMGLEIGKRGLMSHQQALHTTGHNISNAENEEYSRQRVVITSADPLYLPSLNRANTPGNIGQGSVVSTVERVRDAFIDDRIITEKNVMGYWKSKNDFTYQVETVYNEPSDASLRSRMDGLWKSFQELSKYPELRSTREVVKEKAVNLANEVQQTHRQLTELRVDADRKIIHQVNQINMYAGNIRDLNERIMKSEAVGDKPNDLMDRRDALLEKLSEIVDITVGRSDQDETIVYIGGENLIQGEIVRPLAVKMDSDNHGFAHIVWKDLETEVTMKGGSLTGLIEVRDKLLRDNINDINSFALNLADLTNEIHEDGFGRRGDTNIKFFKNISLSDNAEGNFDLNNDGVNEITAIFKVTGANKIDPSAAIGMNGQMSFKINDESETIVKINYRASDTINGIVKKINDKRIGMSAYVNHNNEFVLKSTVAQDMDRKNYMIRHMEDSGQFLVGLTGVLKQTGIQGAFDYNEINMIRKLHQGNIALTPEFEPASYMAVSDFVARDVDVIAAAKGKDIGGTGDVNKTNGIGDGSNALELASMRHKLSMIDKNSTFDEFYTSLISKIGTQGEEAADRIKNQEILLKNLTNLRESVSGINLDEEMANMVAFQHGYNASARVISTMDRMLDVIINRMGV